MKIVHVETLISAGSFASSRHWKAIRGKLHRATKAVDWPEGNGVKPIKNECIRLLLEQAWSIESTFEKSLDFRLGGLDATLSTRQGVIAMEWETGNISSSHRAINKMAICILRKQLVAGTLVVPSRKLYRFLTDRIGNFSELEPYLDLWKAIPCETGVLEIVVIEHDAESFDVPRIPKGTDGRSLA